MTRFGRNRRKTDNSLFGIGPVVDILIFQPGNRGVRLKALIDTGYDVTIVRPVVATGFQRSGTCTDYIAKTSVPVFRFDIEIKGTLTFNSVQVCANKVPQPYVECLIGRNLLNECVFIYDGTRDRFEIRERPLKSVFFMKVFRPWYTSSIEPTGCLIDVVLAQNGKTRKLKAVIDTGASRTAVLPQVVTDLELVPNDRMTAAYFGVGGDGGRQHLYDVSLTLPGHKPITESIAPYPHIQQGADCLIGRDVLRHGKFIYDGLSGRYYLSLRT
jgi:predicted aspartyl protease